MLSVVVDEQARAELAIDLDELFCEGARRMLAVALEAEVEAYITAHAELVDEPATGWWCATGTRRGARWPPGWARSRWSARGSMTGGWIPPPASASSSRA